MASSPSTGLSVDHPAPARYDAHPAALIFALTGGPTAWLGQLVFGFASTSYFCAAFGRVAAPGWLDPAIVALNLIGLATALGALLTGVVLLGETRHEHQSQPHGLLEAGEGRTRFLAIWGICISMVFIVATLANSLSVALVPLCWA